MSVRVSRVQASVDTALSLLQKKNAEIEATKRDLIASKKREGRLRFVVFILVLLLLVQTLV